MLVAQSNWADEALLALVLRQDPIGPMLAGGWIDRRGGRTIPATIFRRIA